MSTPPYPAGCYCYTCDKSFGRPSQLRRHLKMTLVHNSGARVHRCPHCNKGFTQKSNIAEHVRAVHGLVPEGSRVRSRGGSAAVRRSETPPSPGLGKRPAGENARRRQVIVEAAPVVILPTIPKFVVPPSIGVASSVNVFQLGTLKNIFSKSFNSGLDYPNFKEGSGADDDFMYLSASSSSSEAGSPSPSCDFTPLGPSSFGPFSSIPTTNNPFHILSPEDIETNQIEEQVRAYFADLEARHGAPGLIAAFPYPSSVNAVAVDLNLNLGEGPSRLPQVSNNVNGAFSSGPSHYPTQQLPPLSSNSSSLFFGWCQRIETQRRNNELQYYDQRYNLGNFLEEPLSNSHLTVHHNGTVRPQEIEQQQPQQLDQLDRWSPNYSDDLSLGLSDHSTDEWYSGYTPTP